MKNKTSSPLVGFVKNRIWLGQMVSEFMCLWQRRNKLPYLIWLLVWVTLEEGHRSLTGPWRSVLSSISAQVRQWTPSESINETFGHIMNTLAFRSKRGNMIFFTITSDITHTHSSLHQERKSNITSMATVLATRRCFTIYWS